MAKEEKQIKADIDIRNYRCFVYGFRCNYIFPGKVFPTWSSIYRYAGVNETASTDTYPFMVSYLDVGQADCELITCGDQAVLIDSGDIDAYDKVAAYLNALDIKK